MTNAPDIGLVITPRSGSSLERLREVWRLRELVYFLTWRDVKVRYKQTALGAAWAIIQPVLTMLVFSLFFGKLANVPSDGVPYPIFVYAALIPWTYFQGSVTVASSSLVGNQSLVTKVYLPRLSVVLSPLFAALLDFLLASSVLVAMMLYYEIVPSAYSVHLSLDVLLLGPLILLMVMSALGASLWLSALNVRFRDVRYAVPFLLQFCLFATPVAYSATLLHEPWRTLYAINPMVTVVSGFRWVLVNGPAVEPLSAALSVTAATVMVLSGLWYFNHTERSFADVI